jgi:hypothetical protein
MLMTYCQYRIPLAGTVMDISSARLTSLLKEALTLEPLPSATADPVKTALIKAIVAPPTPAAGPSQPVAAALPALLPAVAARVQQQLSSAEVEQAYQSSIEPVVADEAAPMPPAQRRPATDGETAQRGLVPPSARGEDIAKPVGSPWLALLAAEISPLRGASVQGAPVKQRQAGTRPADAARIEHRHELMSLAAGLLAAAIVGFVVLLLR